MPGIQHEVMGPVTYSRPLPGSRYRDEDHKGPAANEMEVSPSEKREGQTSWRRCAWAGS